MMCMLEDRWGNRVLITERHLALEAVMKQVLLFELSSDKNAVAKASIDAEQKAVATDHPEGKAALPVRESAQRFCAQELLLGCR